MDLPAAHWARAPPVRRARRRDRWPGKVPVPDAPGAAWVQQPLRQPPPCPLAGLRWRGRTGGRPGRARPGPRGGPEPGHVQARFGDDRPGGAGADAGADPPGSADRVRGGVDRVLGRGGRPARQGGVVQVYPDQPGVVAAERHAAEGLPEAACPPRTPPRAGAAGVSGSRSPAAMACRMPRAVLVPDMECTADGGLTGAPPAASPAAAAPWPGRGPAAASRGPAPAAPGSAAAARTTAAAGPSRRAGRSAARPSGRSPAARPAAWRAASSPAGAQPGARGQAAPDPPAGRRCLHDDQLHPAGEQPPGQRRHPPRRRGDLLRPRAPPAAPAGRRQPRAHVRLRLRGAGPRPPLAPELAVLVPHQPRGYPPRPRAPQPGLPSSEPVTRRPAPGTPVSWLAGRQY